MKTVTVEFENEDEYLEYYFRLRDFSEVCWNANDVSDDLEILDKLMDKMYPIEPQKKLEDMA